MSTPSYMRERSYTAHVASSHPLVSDNYAVEALVLTFETQVYNLFVGAEEHLRHEEYRLGLDAFEELQLLIFNTVHPTMPVDPHLVVDKLPMDPILVGILAEHAATMLAGHAACQARLSD